MTAVVDPLLTVLAAVATERREQDATWGEQNHRDGTGPSVPWLAAGGLPAEALREQLRGRCQRHFATGDGTWLDILLEEVAEAFAEVDPAKLRTELIQIGAVAAAWVEAIDRRSTGTAPYSGGGSDA